MGDTFALLIPVWSTEEIEREWQAYAGGCQCIRCRLFAKWYYPMLAFDPSI